MGVRMSDLDGKDPLSSLGERIDAAKEAQAPKPRADEHYSQAQLAWRMVIELVAGIVIGGGLGYGLDHLFGTMPVFLVIFIFLGLAAGVNVMLRSAKEVQADLDAAESDDKG